MGEVFIVRRGGGGGAGLNFTVVGGTTQPASPKENTLWANTSISINAWVYAYERPTTPEEGLLWIKAGLRSNAEIDVGGKHGLKLYPAGAEIYTSGTWVGVAIKIYANGEWKSPTQYLYEPHNLYRQLTNGWSSDGYTRPNSGAGSYSRSTIVTESDDYCHVDVASSSTYNYVGIVGTQQKIKLKGFSKLKVNIVYNNNDSTQTARLAAIAITPEKTNIDTQYYNWKIIPYATRTGLFELDIPENVDEAYISISTTCFQSNTVYLRADNIWLE